MGIVRSHGGFMKVHSRPNEGSTFSVYLPASSERAEDDGGKAAPALFHGNGETVLVVDDEPAVRDVCSQILMSLGLRVRTANDGHAALAILGDESLRLTGVITDLHMPSMDGLELTRIIRRRWPALGVVLSSGRVDKADAAVLAELGIAAQLDKPFTIESLSAALTLLIPHPTAVRRSGDPGPVPPSPSERARS
jgi:CheY-like chemotaxis protein